MPSTEKVISWILKGGLLLTPFLVFLVTRSLYFPFITGKNFAFRILIEFLAVIWVFAVPRYPCFRPQSSAVSRAVIIFIAAMGIATAFALSPYHSFWSVYERMEGYVGLLHLFLYFLLLGSIFTAERDWIMFFHTSLIASILASSYAILQLAGELEIHERGRMRVDATFGNAPYLAAYLLFHLFFLLWFFFRFRNIWLRVGYAAAFVLEVVALYCTATRGAVLGLLGGLVVFALIMAIVQGGRIRRWAMGAAIAVLLVPVLFFSVRNTQFVRKSEVLERFATISVSDRTTQARLTIWQMAFQGWLERPILGWGQESVTYVFSKYYEPSLWQQEPWFDRAHNAFLDWLIAGGIVGLASYLAIFGTAVWLLIRLRRLGRLELLTFGILISLLAAYFFQNLFVFDNLTSYLLFFAVIAYIHSISRIRISHTTPVVSVHAGIQAGGTTLALIGFVFVLYFWNIKPIGAAGDILSALTIAQRPEAAGKVDDIIAIFKHGIDLDTFGTTELREQVSQAANLIAQDQAIAAQDKSKYFQFALSELESARQEFPSDVRVKALLATLYLTAGRPADALGVINEAIAISSRRPQFFFIVAEAELNAGQTDKAIEHLRHAVNLAPGYPDAVMNLATVLIVSGKEAEAEAVLVKQFGTPHVGEPRLGQAYMQARLFDQAVRVWESLVVSNPTGYRERAQLGIAYAALGRKGDAIREVERAIALEPAFKNQGQQILQQIRSRTIR